MNSDDFTLLNFNTYEEYLDSFVIRKDLYYLQNTKYARILPQLGYRSASETLTKEQFINAKEILYEILNPSKKPHTLTSEGYHLNDIFLFELSLRERSNRIGLLSTIIFLRHRTKKGYEISGYIDFEDSLRRSIRREEDSVNWNLIFAGKKRLWPRQNDLGYFHWRSGYSIVNNTDNFKVITDTKKGLLFMSRHDRLMICVDPLSGNPGTNSLRTSILQSDKYDHVVLYDHVIRNKI